MCVRVYVFVYYMIFRARANASSALQPRGCNAAVAGGLKRTLALPTAKRVDQGPGGHSEDALAAHSCSPAAAAAAAAAADAAANGDDCCEKLTRFGM